MFAGRCPKMLYSKYKGPGRSEVSDWMFRQPGDSNRFCGSPCSNYSGAWHLSSCSVQVNLGCNQQHSKNRPIIGDRLKFFCWMAPRQFWRYPRFPAKEFRMNRIWIGRLKPHQKLQQASYWFSFVAKRYIIIAIKIIRHNQAEIHNAFATCVPFPFPVFICIMYIPQRWNTVPTVIMTKP